MSILLRCCVARLGEPRLVNEQTEIGLILAVPGMPATLTLAPWIIHLFYTGEFLPASELSQWFILECLGRVLSWPLGFVTWTAEFLYRPLHFAGVGLSDQQSSIWWLLARHARNHARVGKAANATVRTLRGRDNRPAFWRTRPFGIEPVCCDEWDAGWARLLKLPDRSEKEKC